MTEMIRGVMELHADGTFTSTGESSNWCGMEGEPVALRREPFTVTGTYTLHGPRGDTIRVTAPGMEVSPRGPRIVGVIEGDEMMLTLTNAGVPNATTRHRRQ